MGYWKIKLRMLLLGIFFFTLTISSAAIITYTFKQYAKSIHQLSLGFIDRAGSRIYERIGCIVQELERLPAMGMAIFKRWPEISLGNTPLNLFFLEVLNHDSNLSSYYLGTPDGGYLLAINLTIPNIPIPPSILETMPRNAIFLLILSNSVGSQTRAFYDRDLNLISSDKVQDRYDPRNRPWYIGGEKEKKTYWTDIYAQYFTKMSGISVVVPFYNKDGDLKTIIGADLSLILFSQFLEIQNLSKHGRAFILNKNGDILLPAILPSNWKPIVGDAFRIFKEKHIQSFDFDFEKENYLAALHPFPTSYDMGWKIAFIAPSSDFLAGIFATQHKAVFLSLAILAAALILAAILAIHISRPIVLISREIDRIARLFLDDDETIHSHISEIDLINSSVAHMKTAFRSFGHYVPKEIARELMRRDHEIVLGGEKKSITIFFSDIANFTTITESYPIETIVTLLTEYFEALSEIILKYEGTIDKFIGDGIMSIWGAPKDLPDAADKACTAALLCQKRVSILNEKHRKDGMPEFKTRIGLKTGPGIVGNFGTKERMNYSVLGDSVNTASRLQELNKKYRTQIIIGEETMKIVGSQFLTRPLEGTAIRGKKTKIKVYELIAKKDAEKEIAPTLDQMELCSLFEQAFDTFEKGKLKEAKEQFEAILKKFPDDFPTKLYCETLN